MKTEYKYLRFVEHVQTGKTRRWECRNIKHNTSLGWIGWSGAWRQYVFNPEDQTMFSRGCLADIQDFMQQAMQERG